MTTPVSQAAALRDAVENIRRKPYPLSDLIPLLQQSADAIDALLAKSGTLEKALKIAEAALADIGDADREPGDDLAWCEARAAQDLPVVRAALAATPQTAAPATERGTVGEKSEGFTASNGERRNPLYEGCFDEETQGMSDARRHWAIAAQELADRQQRAHQAQGDGREPLTEERILEGWGRGDVLDLTAGLAHRNIKRELMLFTEAVRFAEKAQGIVPRNQSSQESAEGGK